MKKIVIAVVVLAVLGASVTFILAKKSRHHVRPVIADAEQHNTQMNACVKAALEKHPGAVLEIEMEQEDGKLNFDVDIQGKDGQSWEVECDSASGQITEDGPKKRR